MTIDRIFPLTEQGEEDQSAFQKLKDKFPNGVYTNPEGPCTDIKVTQNETYN